MNGNAPDMMVKSRAWTVKGKTSPPKSRRRYTFMALFSSLQVLHDVVIFDVKVA